MLDVERIVNIIEKSGYSCNSIEKSLGFGSGAIRRWKTNSPSIKKLYELSNFLNVDINYLLTGEGEPRPSTADQPPAAPPILSETEEILLDKYRSVDRNKRRLIIEKIFEIANQQLAN